jgi:hypothetical protein
MGLAILRLHLSYVWVSVMLVIWAGNAAAITRPTLPVPADLPSRYGLLGVGIEAAGDTAVVVASTIHDSPAARAGLQAGDLILAAAQYRISRPKDLSRFIQSLEPGTEVTLLIEREVEARQRFTITCTVTHLKDLYSLMNERGNEPPHHDRPRHQRWLSGRDSMEVTALGVVEGHGHTQALMDLRRTLAFEGDRYGSDLRLADVQVALTHPLKLTAMADDLRREVSGPRDLSEYLRLAADRLDIESVDEQGHPAPSGGQTTADSTADREMFTDADWPQVLMRELLVPFARAARHAESAFGDLSAEEHDRLLRQVPALLAEFTRARVLDEGDSSATALHATTLRLAKRVDVAQLLVAARILAALTTPDALKRIHKAARSLSQEDTDLPATFDGEFLCARQTDRGWILVGGKGDNVYGEDAAVIVDLGGDDVYLNNCGGTLFVAAEGEVTYRQRSAVGLLIDFDGDDEYVGNGWGSMGAAIGGVSFLIDLKGDDSYGGDRLTQGSAFCGVGVLWDRSGDDRYNARQPAQAAAFFGAGLLLDDSGSDHYVAAEQAQGFGGAAGFGLLHDRKGDDRYMADRAAPSSYGSAGIYQGWSQGVGCGFRRSASGGIGALVDGGGDDLYQAGNFSQGTGYFFGLGMLVDVNGDDRYRSSRYSQGSAAHQAVGCLLDISGDDDYFARQVANQGAAWDAAVGVLEDRAGDDNYQGGGLAQGAASMNGVGVLFDWAGSDRYQAVNGQGRGGSVEYWGGRDALNLGILIDTGAGTDHYSEKGRGDNHEQATSKVGLFMDR